MTLASLWHWSDSGSRSTGDLALIASGVLLALALGAELWFLALIGSMALTGASLRL